LDGKRLTGSSTVHCVVCFAADSIRFAGLKVVGTAHVLLSTSEDLPLLTSALPQLQQLHFAGGFTELRPAGRPVQVRCMTEQLGPMHARSNDLHVCQHRGCSSSCAMKHHVMTCHDCYD
jgi:hypothetical protein